MRLVIWAAALGVCGCASSRPASPPAMPSPTVDSSAIPAQDPIGKRAHPETAEGELDAPSQSREGMDSSDEDGRITIDSSNADGVSTTDQHGRKIQIAHLAYTAFLRQRSSLDSTEVENANVQFGAITADGITANDVVCRLAPWDVPIADGVGAAASTAAIIAFAMQDAVSAAAALLPADALKRCGEGIRPRVSWAFSNSQVQSVDVTGVAADQANCIRQSIRAAAALNSGACAATLAL